VRLDMRRIDQIKQGTQTIGGRHKVKVAKNKVAAPFRVAEFDLMYAEGISKEGGLLDVGVQMGLVKKSGAFFAYGETQLGQGRENAKEFLRQHPAVSAQLEHAIRGEVGTVQGAADTGDDSTVQLALEA
jgi:recombination protein RecA